ncbi:MAG TPA: YtxH domain-containing protein [Pyrinomonadaceae bacterium]
MTTDGPRGHQSARLESEVVMTHERPLPARRDDGDAGARVAFLLLGGLLGAAAALLFAPKSGRELRADIADATRKGVDQARERATEYYETTRERATELYNTASDRATELATGAREAALRRGETLQAAIEAGKRAYAEEKRRTEAAGILEQAPTYYEEIKDAGQS